MSGAALERVILALDAAGCGPGRGGNYRCPAHDDRNPSLHVAQGRSGAVLTCHAGCSIGDVCGALSLSERDLFDEDRRSAHEQLESYRYTDESGRLLYEVVRFQPKDFRQRRPDGAGGWVWKLGDVRQVPYRLPQVIKAVAAGEVVYVVEGERDVHALEAVGVTATCNSGGAGKWRSTFGDFFEDAKVVIVPDRDRPGYRHAAEVRASLTMIGGAAHVTVVMARAGKDSFDHLSAGHGVDEFVPLDPAELDRLCEPEPVDVADEVAHFEASDLGNARRLVSEHGADLRHGPQLGQWYAFDGRRFREDLTGEASRRAKATGEVILDEARATGNEKLFRHGIKAQSASGIANMLTLAATEPDVPVTVEELDADPMLFNVANGTIDLVTGELRPHRRTDLLTKLAPVIYDIAARCPNWERFLEEVFLGDCEVIGFLRRYAGYSLSGNISEQVLAFLHGSGANGKTTLLNALAGVAGDYAMHLDPAVLTSTGHEQHPTGLTDLRGARFVSTVETEAGRRLNEALVKTLTGGDPIRARRMHRDFFEFQPTHKLWMAGNHLPRIDGTDHAVWRRLALVPFTARFDGNSADKRLPERLAAEAPGILAWMVRGCLEWQRDGLRIPAAVKVATSDYRAAQDHVGRFLAEACLTDDNATISARHLRVGYEIWCGSEGERPWTAQALGRELTSRGYDRTKGGRSGHNWLGLDLIEASA